LAKTLAKELFDDDKKGLLRFDMSEYMESHSVARLVGAPPGYVGHESGGQLEQVRKHPYCVLLFDEIEKAHPQVLNILLQILDDGRMTDGKGRLIDFSNTVIIMTSNVGSHLLANSAGHVSDQVESQVMQLVRSSFKPELLNRITDIVIFHALGKTELIKIVRILLGDVGSRLASKDIKLDISDLAASYILDESFDPTYGARPIRRYLEKLLVTQLARLLITGDLREHSLVTVLVNGEEQGKVWPLNDHCCVKIEDISHEMQVEH
jgi:ATP-dependent Clp protease ATP-binding subunit ClpB